MSERPHLGLRVEGVSNSLWNEDLAAVPKDDRTWHTSDFVSSWFTMSVCIPAWMLASGLIAAGMNWNQALGTILLGNLIVLLPMVLNSHAGAKYGIPYTTYLRASFGVLGARVPAMLRALVACGWFGIQCWIGGEALFRGLRILLPGLGGNTVWWCFAAFWLLNLAFMWRGNSSTRSLRMMSASAVLFASLALLFWMVGRAGGVGPVFADMEATRALDARALARPDFWKIFVPSLTAVVGFWAAALLNISDSTRRAQSQRSQTVGQAIGLPLAMTMYSLIAIAVTAATVIVTPDHHAVWNPVQLVASIPQPIAALVGLATLFFATLITNLAANAVSPSNAFSNLRPGIISSRMGCLITCVLGVAWMPWRLVADPERYIHGWLIGSSGLLGPVAGIMIIDYFVIRERWLDLNDLYVRDGTYEYREGVNRRAMVALAAGIVVAMVGFFVPRLEWLYDFAWFAGFAVAALVYLALMRSPDVRAMIPPNPLLIPVDGFEPEPTA